MLGTLAEDALIRGLADEADDDGLVRSRDLLDALTRARKVGGTRVARSRRSFSVLRS